MGGLPDAVVALAGGKVLVDTVMVPTGGTLVLPFVVHMVLVKVGQ